MPSPGVLRPRGDFNAAWLGTIVALLGATHLTACERKRTEHGPPATARSGAETKALRDALETYANLAFASYSDAVNAARALLATVDRFVLAPSAAGLEDARRAWLAARRPYQQTEVFRFYDGPIDAVEMRVNTWPIDEGYVEASARAGKLGIIEDAKTYPELTSELLSELNAKEGETSISTGYHVIEFLLWGKDTRADGPGERKHDDFVGEAGTPAARRGRYLQLALGLLVRDLEGVRDAWSPARADNYRAKFLVRPPGEALALVIKGMGSLSGPELSGERLTVAYETKAQENEHSCFSDNTVNDLADDALGLQNVCLGQYAGATPVSGTGLCAALATRDAALAERLRASIAASVEKVRAIPAPFDRAILGNDAAAGRSAILGAIHALQAQTAALTEVGAAYDVRLGAVATRQRP